MLAYNGVFDTVRNKLIEIATESEVRAYERDAGDGNMEFL